MFLIVFQGQKCAGFFLPFSNKAEESQLKSNGGRASSSRQIATAASKRTFVSFLWGKPHTQQWDPQVCTGSFVATDLRASVSGFSDQKGGQDLVEQSSTVPLPPEFLPILPCHRMLPPFPQSRQHLSSAGSSTIEGAVNVLYEMFTTPTASTLVPPGIKELKTGLLLGSKSH